MLVKSSLNPIWVIMITSWSDSNHNSYEHKRYVNMTLMQHHLRKSPVAFIDSIIFLLCYSANVLSWLYVFHDYAYVCHYGPSIVSTVIMPCYNHPANAVELLNKLIESSW